MDDDPSIRRTLELHLQEEGYEVVTAEDGREGLEEGRDPAVDVVLLDLRLPRMDGFEVLKALKEDRPHLPVVIITAYDDMSTAVEAIRLGAVDHLGKPLDLERIDEVLHKVSEMIGLSERGYAFCEEPGMSFESHAIVGRSRAMKELYKTIGAVADAPTTVLLHGESGTGKELVARAIHYNGRYRNRPFVPVACSALAPTLLESELFGHERGAFTGAHQTKVGKFELAQGGTLFLDEVSEIPPDIQVKLLRFLQEKEFERVGGLETLHADVRVIAASNRDLAALASEGSFRRDLFYRLQVVSVDLPPLRERREDLPLLVQYFLGRIRRETGRSVDVVPREAMAALLEYSWPGNVRELENALRRAVLLSPGKVLLPETLQLGGFPEGARLPLIVKSLREVERDHIENILRYTAFEKKRAAEILGISRPTLDKRLREYGIGRKP